MLSSGHFDIKEIKNLHGTSSRSDGQSDHCITRLSKLGESITESTLTSTDIQQERYHQIDIVTKERCYFQTDRSVIALEAGELLWSHKDYHPTLLNMTNAASLLQIRFPILQAIDLQLCKNFELELLYGKVFRLTVKRAIDLQQFLQRIEDIRAEESVMKDIALEEFKLILRRLSQYKNHTETVSTPVIAKRKACYQAYRMVAYITEHFQDDLPIEKITSNIGLNKNFAMGLFKKVMGLSLLECITSIRVHHAERLLITTDDDITSIAFASGFSSLSRFYEVFGKYFRDSPKRYRSNYRKKLKVSTSNDTT
ncbi:hypothetical protein BTA51_07280 [Hahella sp. CCB-MM4]|uniref:helix-turn-helix domain-containing protein n=1 Tax=Hahella sp. (strain CCB-MM4) TaxID=1926491 RepID=UPI000B9B0EBB|nr:helix-turn-helix domain-containing protein [Hahella sp. CCB-MM4]OZG73617.1 hypothetical protein BTA51_07280 [Hahella sp. CCB-MM4]